MDKDKANMNQKGTASKMIMMYDESKDWISKIEFYHNSQNGLKKIIDRYLDEIVLHENLDEISSCVSSVLK